MTVPPRTPSWAEIEQFCRIDGWEPVREIDHRFFQKVLASGEVLETHSSFDSRGSMSQGRFNAMLRTQLRVTREMFWETLRAGQPVERPAPVESPSAPRHRAYVLRVLTQELRKTEEEIAQLSAEEGERLVHEHWSRPSA